MKDSLYKTLIVDDRYKYILSGLTTTVIIAFCMFPPKVKGQLCPLIIIYYLKYLTPASKIF